MSDFVIPPPPRVSLPVLGSHQRFAVQRIFCVGRNYAAHAREMGDSGKETPFFFLKPSASVLTYQNSEQELLLPYPSLTQDLHHEVELVIAIGERQQIWGYAVGLDMTRRDLQAQMKAKGRPWCIGKAFENSAPIGALTPADTAHAQGFNPSAAAISLSVDGELRQNGNTADMIFQPLEIISELSTAWNLQAGDLIMTGTPEGVGAVTLGQELHARVQGLADLRVRISAPIEPSIPR